MATTAVIDLKQFCADEVGRYDMTKPFECEGMACATDGKICVRIPVADYGKPFEPRETKTPPVGQLEWDKTPENVAPLKLSAAMIFKCEDCDGKGKRPQTTKCHMCQGSGKCPCDGECPHCTEVCKECDGDGKEPIYGTKVVCEECLGTGDQNCVFDGCLFSRKILGSLAGFPNIHGGIVNRKSGMAKFVFDGGEALVMAMKNGDRELDKRLKSESG